jgi:hypothetical protein
MLTACIGKQEDNRRNPRSAADLQQFSRSVGTRLPRLPSAYRRTCRTPAAGPGPSTGRPGADTRRRQMKGLHR